MTNVNRAWKGKGGSHMKKFIISNFNYALFDGEGAAGAAPAGQQTDVSQNQTGGEKVVYGKQPELKESVAETQTDNQQETNPTPEDLRAKYDEFMKDDKMREFANQDTQKIINRRFRENKTLQETIDKQSGVMERLIQKFGVEDPDELCKAIDNDNAFWEAAAVDAGMDVETFKKLRIAQREAEAGRKFREGIERQRQAQEQYSRWVDEANELKAIYPEFDLETELKNPDFRKIIGQPNQQYAISMKQAYEIIHHDEIINGIRQTTADETQKRVVDNVRSRGTRPVEGAVHSQSGVVVKSDVTKLTKEDRAEIAKRVLRGETISF